MSDLAQLEQAAAIHGIAIDKMQQSDKGRWFIRCYQELNDDGCRYYGTYIYHDLDDMVSILIKHFRFNEEVNLMNIFSTELFSYLAGEMFLDGEGRPITVALTVDNVKMDNISNGKRTEAKPVVSFKEKKKLLVLNKTNARAIATQYGGETDNWIGKQIALTAQRGEWFGKSGVRVVVLDHMPANAIGYKPPQKAIKAPAKVVEVDDVDFDQEPLFADEPAKAGAFTE